MKKKERTQEQKTRRFKIAAGTVAFLLVFFIMGQLFNGSHRRKETTDELTTEMDRQLDSLVKSRFADTLKVVWTGAFESVPFDDDLIPEVIAFKKESMRHNMLEMTARLDTSSANIRELKDSREKLRELEKEADAARKKYEGKVFCTARGIHLEGKDGQLYAGFQTCSEGTSFSNIEGIVRINKKN